MLDTCENCNTSFKGDPIPARLRESGAYGDATHWRREIGVEVRGVYDGVLYYACPDCGHAFHRFPEGDPRRARAEFHMNHPVVV